MKIVVHVVIEKFFGLLHCSAMETAENGDKTPLALASQRVGNIPQRVAVFFLPVRKDNSIVYPICAAEI